MKNRHPFAPPRARLGPTVLMFAALACTAEPDDWRSDPTFVHEREHVTVYGYDREPEEVLGGSYTGLDTHVAAVNAFLEIDEPPHLDYRWMTFDFMLDRCPSGNRGCIVGADIYAQSLPNMLEIADFVARHRPDGGCAGFLAQGLAEYLGGPSLRTILPSNRDVRRLMMEDEPLDTHDSARAGHFVSFLVETYGSESIAGLCDAVGNGDTLAEWEAGFVAALDVGLGEVLNRYETYPLCSVQQFRARLWECAGAPDFVFEDEDDVLDLEVVGVDPRAMNTTPGAAGDAMVIRLVDVADGVVLISMGTDILLQQCAPCSARPEVIDTQFDRAQRVPEGRYELVVFFESDDEPFVHVGTQMW